MTQYTKEKKEHALTLMSAPQNKPVPEVAKLTGIPEAMLYLWRKQARSAGRAVPGDGQNPEDWSAADKFAVVLETAPLGEAELAEYCRQKACMSSRCAAGVSRRRPHWARPIVVRLNAPRIGNASVIWRRICDARRRRWRRQLPCWCCRESTRRCGPTTRTHDCVAAAPATRGRHPAS